MPRGLHRSTACSIRWLWLSLKHHHPHCECQYPWTSVSHCWFLFNDGFLRSLINPVKFAVLFFRQKIWMKVSGPFPCEATSSCAIVGWSHGFVLWLLSRQARWYPLLWYSPLFSPGKVSWKALMKRSTAPFMHSDRATVCHSVSLSSHLFAPLMFCYLLAKGFILSVHITVSLLVNSKGCLCTSSYNILTQYPSQILFCFINIFLTTSTAQKNCRNSGQRVQKAVMRFILCVTLWCWRALCIISPYSFLSGCCSLLMFWLLHQPRCVLIST